MLLGVWFFGDRGGERGKLAGGGDDGKRVSAHEKVSEREGGASPQVAQNRVLSSLVTWYGELLRQSNDNPHKALDELRSALRQMSRDDAVALLLRYLDSGHDQVTDKNILASIGRLVSRHSAELCHSGCSRFISSEEARGCLSLPAENKICSLNVNINKIFTSG